ncbi:alkaline phosphatase family protein [Saccharopolyspora hattusasensis]|uniref:alkaline phosphatase family protein n=1 Tax=Saccharopolyspora hattusasensis TaxID=1128679 RepID=UPI003D9914F1
MNIENRAFDREATRPLVVLLVVDGLRAVDLTESALPRLFELVEDGVRCVSASTVVPSVTRAAAASLVTGRLPRHTGVLGNRIWTPGGLVDTASVCELLAMRSARGRVVEARTLGEILAAEGRRLMVVGSGSPGCAYLLHSEVDSVGGALVMAAFDPVVGPVLPVDLRDEVRRWHGPPPARGADSREILAWGVDVASGAFFDGVDPDVLLFWCGEPDEVRHAHGVDAAPVRDVLARIDEELGRLVSVLRGKGRPVNVIVTSDHGMVDLPPGAVLGAELFADLPEHLAERATICINAAAAAIHLPAETPSAVHRELALWCRGQAWADTVFMSEPDLVPGVLPMKQAGCDHPHLGPAVLVTADPRALPVSTSGQRAATHGTLLHEDIRIPLVMQGPAFARSLVVDRPVTVTDILPTLLHVLGVPAPGRLDGIPITEAITGHLTESATS